MRSEGAAGKRAPTAPSGPAPSLLLLRRWCLSNWSDAWARAGQQAQLLPGPPQVPAELELGFQPAGLSHPPREGNHLQPERRQPKALLLTLDKPGGKWPRLEAGTLRPTGKLRDTRAGSVPQDFRGQPLVRIRVELCGRQHLAGNRSRMVLGPLCFMRLERRSLKHPTPPRTLS